MHALCLAVSAMLRCPNLPPRLLPLSPLNSPPRCLRCPLAQSFLSCGEDGDVNLFDLREGARGPHTRLTVCGASGTRSAARVGAAHTLAGGVTGGTACTRV